MSLHLNLEQFLMLLFGFGIWQHLEAPIVMWLKASSKNQVFKKRGSKTFQGPSLTAVRSFGAPKEGLRRVPGMTLEQ